MPSFVTPARLAALVGVLTGLSAAATSALNVIPHDTAVGRAVVGAIGVLGTVITVTKFLEGQAGWEQLQESHVHAAVQNALGRQHELTVLSAKHAHEQSLYADAPKPEPDADHPPEVSLEGEVPIDSSDQDGQIVTEADPVTGEPLRLSESA